MEDVALNPKVRLWLLLNDLHESKWQPTLTLDGQPVRYNTTPKFLWVKYDRQITFSRDAALVGNKAKDSNHAKTSLNELGI